MLSLVKELRESLQAARSFSDLTSLAPKMFTSALGAERAVFTLMDRWGPFPEARWFPVNFPDHWFGEYEAIAPYDFVREATTARPGEVLIESEMVPPEVLRRSPMMHRAQDLSLSLQHAMAVALPVDTEWVGGIALFRGEEPSFGEGEKAILRELLPALREALRTCSLLERAGLKADLLEQLFEMNGEGVLAYNLKGRELFRTPRATALLSKWFPKQRGHALPLRIDELLGKALLLGETGQIVIRGEEDDLIVSALRPGPLERGMPEAVVLSFRERSRFPLPPDDWLERLSPREYEVTRYMLRGLPTDSIAEFLGCRPATVSKHIQRIFDKLGIESRSALFLQALRP